MLIKIEPNYEKRLPIGCVLRNDMSIGDLCSIPKLKSSLYDGDNISGAEHCLA